MAARKRKMTEGPFVQVAAFCERVLQEQDGVLTLVRVVDRTNIIAEGTDVLQGLPNPVAITLTAVIVLKAGAAYGSHSLMLRWQNPDLSPAPEFSTTVLFEAEDRGVNVIVPVQISAMVPGIYWLEVLVNDCLLTRMPYRVVYQRRSMSPGAS